MSVLISETGFPADNPAAWADVWTKVIGCDDIPVMIPHKTTTRPYASATITGGVLISLAFRRPATQKRLARNPRVEQQLQHATGFKALAVVPERGELIVLILNAEQDQAVAA